jgi:hypothetical protein
MAQFNKIWRGYARPWHRRLSWARDLAAYGYDSYWDWRDHYTRDLRGSGNAN